MPLMILTVAVGSSNPAKIRSVQQALEQLVVLRDGRTLELEGFSVESGVPDQPMHAEETKQGAKNRAQAAFQAFCAKHDGVEPHLAIGLEGGIEEQSGDLSCMAWMAIYGKRSDEVLAWTIRGDRDYTIDDDYSWGLAKTASFVLPPKVTKLVKEDGMELGDADDVVFSRIKSKHGSGIVGILTNDLIDRSKYYEHALILAMIPWIRPDVYPIGHR
jgi:non-canonical (house-cleaning) NTP pyrophosphatase